MVGRNKFLGAVVSASLVLMMHASHAADIAAPRTIADCRKLADQAARLACYDKIPDANAPAPAMIAPAAPAPVVASPPAAPALQVATPVAPQSAPVAQQPPAPSAPVASVAPQQPVASAPPAPATNPAEAYGLPKTSSPKEVKAIVVEVASTGTSSLGKLRIVTTDGMIWEQTIGTPAKAPAVGTKITISDSSMGGHWCEVNKWTAVRCKRVQ